MALRELYYQQSCYFRQNQQYATNLDALLPTINLEGYDFKPELSASTKQYTTITRSASGQAYWRINQDGKIVR